LSKIEGLHHPEPAMIKTILVPVGGGDSDHAVLETARIAASPFAAHLAFFHVRIDAGEAALNTPHADFVFGKAIVNELDVVTEEARGRSAAAERHVRDFCDQWRIPIVDAPATMDRITASFCEEDGRAAERLMARARLSDLVVLARFTRPNGLPLDLQEQLVRGCGRPIIFTARSPAAAGLRTAMVCWKDAAEPARALGAALPYLRNAERVFVVAVDEGDALLSNTAEDVTAYLGWHGIRAQPRSLAAKGQPTAAVLTSAAADCGADFLIMGSFGHGRARAMIFGSCTQAMLRGVDLPILLAH
jgi:nucleotide-binding universal stress UspA family protein